MIWITFSVLSAILSQSFVSGQGPIWANWGQWEKCSKPCGYGTQSRRRECAAWTNQRCLQRASQSCNNFPCTDHQGGGGGGGGQLSTNWGPWQQWSRCSKSCGRGEQRRTRHCTGGRQCQETKIQGCNYHQCQRDRGGGGGGWTDWSKCSASCEGGTQTRTFHGTFETRSETRSCNIQWCDIGEPFDSTWNEWSRWSKCSNNCGTGTKSRTRKCNSNTITLRSLGLCAGPAKEDKICSDTSECDPKWAAWSSWGRCSKTCGGGTSKRSRACLHGTKNQCKGSSSGQRRCSIRNCPAEWSKWSKWSKCSKTCGVGVMRQTRTCGKGAKTCAGSSIRRKSCKLRNCTKEPEWGSWSTWSKCTLTCDGGSRSRKRECQGNGEDCKGKDSQSEACGTIECKKEPNWEAWSKWSRCTKTCGGGVKIRGRICENRATGCKGTNVMTTDCNTGACEKEWNVWGSWSKCSATCGKANRRRVRSCKSQGCMGPTTSTEDCKFVACPKKCSKIQPMKNGKIVGKKDEYRSGNSISFECNTGHQLVGASTIKCKNNGDWTSKAPRCVVEWSEWKKWSECTLTCGKGSQIRKRSCNVEKCDGNGSEVRSCNSNSCPAIWSEWVAWSDCTVECGGGARVRNRVCTTESENKCPGKDRETEDCNEKACPLKAKICKRAVEPPKFCAKSCVNSGDCVGISKYCLCDGACGKTCFDPSRECPKLESPEHGHVELDGLKYGYTANYICDPGFILIGANSTICQSNGMWSESMPECQLASTCGKAGDIGGLFSAAGGRIVGGSKARKGAWPWQGLVIAKASGGSVEKSFNSLRGGFSIINHRWVLTAAHIYDNILPKYKKSLRYVVGITNKPEKGKFSEYAQIFQASEEIVHPQYDQDNFYDFDIALIKTGKKFIVRDGVFVKTDVTLEIQYNRDVRPICLPCWTKYGKNVAVSSSEQAARFGGTACLKVPPKDLNKPGNVVVTGFGRTEVNKRELPLALKQALLHIQNDTVCDDGTEKIREDPHFSKANYTSRMMCTRSGSPHKLMDACSGDSGGPLARLIVNADGSSQWVQVGIVSWGYGCAYVADGYEYPGYFTRLTAMMDFIAEKVTVL